MNTTLIEEWRPVVGYEGLYEVSNIGRVRSLDRISIQPNGRPRQTQGQVLRPAIHNGYPKVNLWIDGTVKTANVHRLVALAFVANPDNLPMVNHIDGDKANNVATNIEWMDDVSNKQHACDLGNIVTYRKTLTPAEVIEIRSLGGTMTQREIAQRFGCSQMNICKILARRTRKDIP